MYSKQYKNIKSLFSAGENLNSYIYQVRGGINENLFVKVPKSAEPNSFNDLIFETQLLKVLTGEQEGKDHLVTIKEEIFELDTEAGRALNYIAFFEKPSYSLLDFLTTSNEVAGYDEILDSQ